jgi:hypothetical protein
MEDLFHDKDKSLKREQPKSHPEPKSFGFFVAQKQESSNDLKVCSVI